MSNRKRVWVSPDGEGNWKVKTQGKEKAAALCELKTEAVEKAKEIAKNATLGQVIIQKKNGDIQTEYTYKKDPYPPKG